MTLCFNKYITSAIENHEPNKVIDFASHPDTNHAVPSPDYFLPLLYGLKAYEGESVEIFNNICNLGSLAMTCYIFE